MSSFEDEGCLFCEPERDASGQLHHAPGCPQGDLEEQRRRVQQEFQRAQHEQNKNTGAPGTPGPFSPQGAAGFHKSGVPAGRGAGRGGSGAGQPQRPGGAFPGLPDPNNPPPGPPAGPIGPDGTDGVDGGPDGGPDGVDGIDRTTSAQSAQSAQSASFDASKLSPEMRAALDAIRASQEKSKRSESATPPSGTGSGGDLDPAAPPPPPPPWMMAYLKEHGVPEGFFAEHRTGTGMPAWDTPAQAKPGAPLPDWTPQPDPKAAAYMAALPAVLAFWSGVDNQITGFLEAVERGLREGYVASGAIYGPSEAGMYQWAGEVAEMQRSANRLYELQMIQHTRRAVLEKFPSFYTREWEVDEPTDPNIVLDPTRNPDGSPLPPPVDTETEELHAKAEAQRRARELEEGKLPPVDTGWMDAESE